MLHSALVNADDQRSDELVSTTLGLSGAYRPSEFRTVVGRKQALGALDEAMRALAAMPAHADLIRSLDAARTYFSDATAEWEIRAADMWNAALRAADTEIRALVLPWAGWSADAQSSACTCALIVRSLAIGSAAPPMSPEEQAQQVVLRG